jgi:hypothetical protein
MSYEKKVLALIGSYKTAFYRLVVEISFSNQLVQEPYILTLLYVGLSYTVSHACDVRIAVHLDTSMATWNVTRRFLAMCLGSIV